jgi:hypothetical protein
VTLPGHSGLHCAVCVFVCRFGVDPRRGAPRSCIVPVSLSACMLVTVDPRVVGRCEDCLGSLARVLCGGCSVVFLVCCDVYRLLWYHLDTFTCVTSRCSRLGPHVPRTRWYLARSAAWGGPASRSVVVSSSFSHFVGRAMYVFCLGPLWGHMRS